MDVIASIDPWNPQILDALANMLIGKRLTYVILRPIAARVVGAIGVLCGTMIVASGIFTFLHHALVGWQSLGIFITGLLLFGGGLAIWLWSLVCS